MTTCKACNNEFEPAHAADKFCDSLCQYNYEAALRKMKHLSAKEPKPYFAFQLLLKKHGWFKIAQKTIDDIYDKKEDAIQFEMLLESQGLMVVRLDNEMSVIKKSIL